MLGTEYPRQNCSLARALEVVGERWTLLILRDAFYGVRRFSDFAVHLDIPRAVLSERLRSLIGDGLLERRPDADHPGRDVYELTAAGREMWPALYTLMRWGERFDDSGKATRTFLHAACDTPLDDRGDCPRCGVTPGPGDVATVGPGAKPVRDDAVSAALHERRLLLEPLVVA